MFAIELSIKLGSVERELDLLGGVDSLLKQAPLVAVSSLGEQQHVTRFQVRVFQRQRPLSTITDATLQAFFLSPLGWHMLLSHASAEACLTGWPNAQLQGKDWCSVARHHHHQANLMVCVVCSCCATSPYREVCRAKGRDREWRDLVPYLPCSAYNHCFSAFSGG